MGGLIHDLSCLLHDHEGVGRPVAPGGTKAGFRSFCWHTRFPCWANQLPDCYGIRQEQNVHTRSRKTKID
jgi:hypothetical protein